MKWYSPAKGPELVQGLLIIPKQYTGFETRHSSQQRAAVSSIKACLTVQGYWSIIHPLLKDHPFPSHLFTSYLCSAEETPGKVFSCHHLQYHHCLQSPYSLLINDTVTQWKSSCSHRPMQWYRAASLQEQGKHASSWLLQEIGVQTGHRRGHAAHTSARAYKQWHFYLLPLSLRVAIARKNDILCFANRCKHIWWRLQVGEVQAGRLKEELYTHWKGDLMLTVVSPLCARTGDSRWCTFCQRDFTEVLIFLCTELWQQSLSLISYCRNMSHLVGGKWFWPYQIICEHAVSFAVTKPPLPQIHKGAVMDWGGGGILW